MKHILNFINKKDWAKNIVKLHFEHSSSLNAPYHSLYHTLIVSNSCIEALKYYINKKYEYISDIEYDSLICAAMFHDFNHSKGKLKDTENVKNAIYAFELWYANNIKYINNINKDLVINIIKATEYPYVIKDEDLTFLQQIIRDSDLCQLLQNDRIKQCYFGLADEMNLTVKQILEGELNFIETVKPNTIWFAEKWSYEKINIINEVNILLNCI